MLVHICDHCHETIDDFMITVEGLGIHVGKEKKYQAVEREFCSFSHMQAYYIDGLKGRGLDNDIVV